MNDCKESKCSMKCKTCQNYDKVTDFCKEKQIENCSKIAPTEFSQCTSYLVNEKLIMF